MTDLPVSAELLTSHRDILCRYQHVIIQHLKPDTAEIVTRLVDLGGRIGHLIAVDYSVDAAVLSSLEDGPIAVSVKPFQEIGGFVSELVGDYGQDDLVIWDVGGYGQGAVCDVGLARKVRFAVEDTNNGLWRYRSARLWCPVIEVASIQNKQVENAFVGRRIVECSELFFSQNGLTMPCEQVVVVGFGGIGQSVCAALQIRGINPAVVEIDDRKLALAYAFGHEIATSIAFLTNAKVIIGCTGAAAIKLSDLCSIRGRAFLISGSSKQIEFNDVLTQGRITRTDTISNALVESETNSVIVNEGKPINLRHDSLNAEMSDFMYANIIAAIVEGGERQGHKIFSLSDSWQREVSRLWVKRHLDRGVSRNCAEALCRSPH